VRLKEIEEIKKFKETCQFPKIKHVTAGVVSSLP